jgi:cytochrome P450
MAMSRLRETVRSSTLTDPRTTVCCGSRKEKEAFNLMGETDMAQYRAHRRLITPAFTAGAMRSLEDGMHKTITIFAQAMVDRGAEQPIDVTLWTNILSIGKWQRRAH